MYSVDLPYPEVNVKDKNPQYIDLIYKIMQVHYFWICAIAQYTYHQISYVYENIEVSQTLLWNINCRNASLRITWWNISTTWSRTWLLDYK